MDNDTLLEIWRRACLIYHFELAVAKAVDAKLIKAPVYLSLGQEFIPATVSVVCQDWPLFAQHRCHGWHIAWGGHMGMLVDELLHGKCGSASIHIPGKMYGHDGLMGSQAPIAAGYALATGKPVVCVLGDGAAEEDYVLSTLGWAETRKLPVMFIVEDNGLSILTPVCDRRSWSIVGIADGFGIPNAAGRDDVESVYGTVADAVENCLHAFPASPFLYNVLCCRHRWHCGTGTDGVPKWNRRELTRSMVKDADVIDSECKEIVEDTWACRVR